jgi:hypothetical protein
MDHMALIGIEALLGGIAAEAGVGIGRVPVYVMIVVIPVPVLLLQTIEVHLGGHVGGVDDVQPVRDQALGPSNYDAKEISP